GLLAFEQDVLRPTEQRLGRLALGFTQAFNEQHREGVNLYGEAGQSFFSDLNDPNLLSTRVSRVDRLTTRPAQMTLQVDDLGQVPLSDYTLSIADDLDGGFRLERESDGALLVSGRVESLFQPLSFDGMTLKTDVEALAPGQVYRLSPFGGAASQLSVLLSDGQELALAERSSVTPSAANAGDGRVVARETLEAGDRAGVESTSLPDDLLVRFLAEDRYEILDNSDPAAPQALDPPLRGLPFSAGQTSPLVNVTPGVSRLESTTLQVGEPQPSVVTLDPAARGLNGYDAQTLQFFDTSGTAESLLDSVTLTANASARSSAEQLAVLPGVRASAYTELQIADIEASLADGAPEILVNGVSLGRVGDLDAFVGAVNASADLASAGIKASLEDGQAVVASIYGDDLTLAVRGAPESVVEVVTDRGQRERLVGQGVGDPPALIGTSDIRGPVTFSAGSDFSVFVNQGNGPGATVTLNGSFASAADLVFDLQSQLDDVLGPAVVEVGLNPGGQIRFVGSDVGSSATLNVAPSSALAGFLGLPASSASGNERYAATTVGGVLSLELDPDTRMRSVGSGLFAAEPETTAPRLPLELRFEGVAQAGDSFAVSLNADNPLGNGIGLELSELQRRGIIGIEGVTIDEALAETVEFVGIRGSKASSDASAAEVLVEQSNARVQAVSGVNLDEEAANLIRFEQAYNASAQVISVARDLFTSLLNAIA
ncbi:MAG: flagellar basal body rod C-terminal domain-containing protein, partial [Pseudomonadota bacterium]